VKKKIEALRFEMEEQTRRGNLERSAAIQYGELPQLEAELKKLEALQDGAAGGQRLLKEEVDEEDIAKIVSKWTGIPVAKMLESEVRKLLEMEARLRERVVGQDEAIAAVANALRRSRAGLSDPKRPIGSFIFLGPTGVGKTETARALAEFLFDDEQAMIRIDMSEYMEKHAVARLIGAPPGYVGYDEGGQLTEAVRRRPYSVVLFDEIEKAHPDVFNVLLQVLDDGRLTDSRGRTVDFKNTVLIMTSNLGAHLLQGENLNSESAFDAVREQVMDVVRQSFRPEFLNRVDDIVIFRPLGEEQLSRIVDLRLADLRKLLAERKITLELSPAARQQLSLTGYDRQYGARPLKRAIQRLIQDPLAMELLDGEIRNGDKVRVEADPLNNKLRFEVVDRVAGAAEPAEATA
jgi:ATP-dependent Clp protease ATP-binding subunit ClpB